MSDNEKFLEIRNQMEQDAIEYLGLLADVEDRLEVVRLRRDEALDNLVPQELKDEMRRIKALCTVESEGAVAEKIELIGQIGDIALALQHTVKGERRQAVWNRGRTSWDNRALTAYAKTHPEVGALKKQGDPYVSIRNVAKK